jgi:hypothetical protein
MSGITKKQARLLRKQIRKIYGRNYIPNLTGDNNISIGDILLDDNDETPVIDSQEFSQDLTKFVEGNKLNMNISSSSDVSISTKLQGEAKFSEYFKINEAGIAVEFNNENQMFLKLSGCRQRSMSNFIEFKKHILERYTKGDISSKVYIVRGLIYADKYFLQYSGVNGGTIGFNIDADIEPSNVDLSANFSLKWRKEVGFAMDGLNGGVLGYRVSAVRLKRDKINRSFQGRILDGIKEEDVLNNTSFNERKELLTSDAIELVDVTDELLIKNDIV